MQENPLSRVTATDVSPTAVRLLEAAAARAGIAPDRVRAFACNSADPTDGDSLLSGALSGHHLVKHCRLSEVIALTL